MPSAQCCFLLQLGQDKYLLQCGVVLDPHQIGFAADLAILHVALPVPSGLIDRRAIPLAATRALETGFHGYLERF